MSEQQLNKNNEQSNKNEAERKARLVKVLTWVAGGLALGGLMCLVYGYGKDEGYDDGYKEGFDAGNNNEGYAHAYYDGLQAAIKAHAKWIYDPKAYSDSARFVARSMYVDSAVANAYIKDETKAELDKEFGDGWRARVVYVRKPEGYDDMPKLEAAAEDAETPETSEESLGREESL